MVKLSTAQIACLKLFPKDIKFKDTRLPGVLRPSKWPKGLSVRTIGKLHKLGLVRHTPWVEYYRCPMCLTDEGRAMVDAIDGGE